MEPPFPDVLPAGDHARVHRIHYRFGVVLVLILAAIIFTLAAPKGDPARFVAVILHAAVLVAAVFASRAHPWVIRASIIGAIVGIMGAGLALFGSGQFGNSTGEVLALLYVLLTPPAIITGVIKQFREYGAVNLQTMFGVLCVYLLIGLVFGVAYGLIEDVSSTPVFAGHELSRDQFLYFSFSTLTTTGYGDVVARTDLVRALAVAEALIGQLYLVTVVAVIISNLRPAGTRSRSGRLDPQASSSSAQKG
jgi:ion channel